MKAILLSIVVLTLASCSPSSYSERSSSGSSARYEQDDGRYNPCQDSLFKSLQTKPYASLTSYEHAYFDQKWAECNGVANTNRGSGPEWISAIISLLGVIAALVLTVK